jgi:hypothetical protein
MRSNLVLLAGSSILFIVSLIYQATRYDSFYTNELLDGLGMGLMSITAAIIPQLIFMQATRFHKPLISKLSAVLSIVYSIAALLIGGLVLVVFATFGCGLFGDTSSCKSGIEISTPILLWLVINVSLAILAVGKLLKD